MRRFITSLGLCISLLSWSALATANAPTPSWDGCLQRYAEDLQIHPDLFRAIIYTESRNHPYAFGWTDRNGIRHSAFPDTLQAATHQLEQLKRSSYRFDTGLGQLNSLNVERLGKRLEVKHTDLLHPCTNLYMSSVILRETLDRHGFTWKAVSAYNGSDQYIALVWQNLCRRHHPPTCTARGWTKTNLAAPLPTDELNLAPLLTTPPTPLPVPLRVAQTPPVVISVPAPDIPAPSAVVPISTIPEHTSTPTQEPSMLSDAFTQAFPAMLTTLSICLRVLLPFAIFVSSIVLMAYGLRIILWAIRSVIRPLRTRDTNRAAQDLDPAERWRTSPSLSSRIRSAA